MVVNGSFESGNIGFGSSYSFVAAPARISTEGEYTVGTDPSTVSIYPDWVSFGDHTTGHGQMLLVNGAPDPGSVVWAETVTVQPGASYALTFWAATINRASASLSTLQAYVNGAPVGSVLTTSPTAGMWSEYTAVWPSGASTTASVTLVDTNVAASYNDFAVDDVAFGCR